MGAVKSDFDEKLHGKNYMPKQKLTKPEGQEQSNKGVNEENKSNPNKKKKQKFRTF